MKKEELYLKIRENGIELDNFVLISKEEYESAVANNEKNIYKEKSSGSDYYFRTNGANDNTMLEIQFKIFQCLKTIKSIVVFTFAAALATGAIALIALFAK